MKKEKKWLVDELDYTNFEWCIDNPYWTFRWYRNEKKFDSCGGKNLCYTCFGALESFLGSSDDPTYNKDYARVMLIISDGQVDDYDVNSEAKEEYYSYSYIKKWANKIGVQIVTIGLGSDESSFDKYLKPLSTATNGKFYYAKDLENVDNIYEYIKKDLGRDIELDSDSDGIPDTYEEGLLMFNGKSIKLDKNNPDTDGDGLLDGEEVELEYRYNVDSTKVMVMGGFNSNPLNSDSDGDGEGDATDPTPLRHQLNEELCKQICKLEIIANDYLKNCDDIPDIYKKFIGYYSDGKYINSDWFVFMFIRQFNGNYVGGNWDGTAGTIDYQFVEYVRNNDPDLYADVDAVNLYKLIRHKGSIDEALVEYFKVGYEDRFTQFIMVLLSENYGTLKDTIYTYTTEYYFMKININMDFFNFSSKWPLLDEDIDKNLSIAAVDSFVEYISEKVGLEYENK